MPAVVTLVSSSAVMATALWATALFGAAHNNTVNTHMQPVWAQPRQSKEGGYNTYRVVCPRKEMRMSPEQVASQSHLMT